MIPPILQPGNNFEIEEQNLVILRQGERVLLFSIDGNNLSIGGNGSDGDVLLFPAGAGNLAATSQATISLNSGGSSIQIGMQGNPGGLVVKNNDGHDSVVADGTIGALAIRGGAGNVRVHLSASDGLQLLDSSEEIKVHLNGATGNISSGGNGSDGDLLLKGAEGKTRIHLSAGGEIVGGSARVRVNGGNGDMILGGEDRNGDLYLRDSDPERTRVHISGGHTDPTDSLRVRVSGRDADLWLGGNNKNGDLIVRGKGGKDRVHISGGDSVIEDTVRVHINGDSGDIILRNGDAAEEFDTTDGKVFDPGTVMVIDGEESLQQSDSAYDKRVAGVVSGAGDYKPGIVLDKKPSTATRLPVALMGKVYCKVDAQYGPIETGDLLTTSPTKGHAMKAEDPFKAFGTVIGKALKPQRQGVGMIPILVSLQ